MELKVELGLEEKRGPQFLGHLCLGGGAGCRMVPRGFCLEL